MCGSTDDGMNNSTCNWVNHTKLYTTSLILSFHCYCRCNVMIVVVGFMSRVLIWNVITNVAKVSFINNKTCVHMILHTVIFQPLIQIMVSW